MTVDDASGAVTFRSPKAALLADDLGVTVRNSGKRTRRLAWSEISHFADGHHEESEGGRFWALEIVLRSGPAISAKGTRAVVGAPETLAALRQLAERHGIPADLTGVRMSGGRPHDRGLYKDPGGRAGLRYWDGKQWSPLLPLAAGNGERVGHSIECWATLPAAKEDWGHAAAQAARWKVWVVVMGILTAALVVAGLVAGVWWRWYDAYGWFLGAGLPGLFLWGTWAEWHRFRKLEKWRLTASAE